MKAVTLYLFTNQMPITKLYMYRCNNTPCNRPLFKYSAEEMIVANSGVTNFDLYEPGSKYIEIECHSCSATYKVLFQ